MLEIVITEEGKAVVVVGTQWGDEAKGKTSHIVAPNATWYVRFNGGNNAGHMVDGKSLHLLSSGILDGKNVGLARGMMLYLQGIFEELTSIGSEELIKELQEKLEIKIKKINIDSKFFIVDRKEILFYLSKNASKDDVAIWINSDFFVQAFTSLFDKAVGK